MSRDEERERDADRLAAEALGARDPTGWFERLYAEAAGGRAVVPWDRAAPNPAIVEWTRRGGVRGHGRRAMVVGAGFGSDAEHVASLGFATVAFDIAPSAVRAARARFPGSPVEYVVADVLDPPAAWREAFAFVVESMTVQALPDPPRGAAIARIAGLVAPGGTLLVFAAARAPDEEVSGPPWPLTRAEIDAFATGGVELVRLEDLAGDGSRHWRAELRRP